MTLCQPEQCEFDPLQRPVFLESGKSVGRTGRRKPACRAEKWSKTPPIQENQPYEQLCSHGEVGKSIKCRAKKGYHVRRHAWTVKGDVRVLHRFVRAKAEVLLPWE